MDLHTRGCHHTSGHYGENSKKNKNLAANYAGMDVDVSIKRVEGAAQR